MDDVLMTKPKLLRTQTSMTRVYLKKVISDYEGDNDAQRFSKIIDDLKFAQRVDPIVDLECHGKPDVAEKLLAQKIMTEKDEEEIYCLIKNIRKNLKDKKEFEQLRILFINATEFGGGVAEMRPNNNLFFKEYGVDAGWAVIDGCEEFYKATVHIHEGIQNRQYSPLDEEEYNVISIVTANNFARFHSMKIFEKYDIIWIDDPQPIAMIPMIKAVYPEKPVVWRCHVHSDPEPSIQEYLSEIITGVFNKKKHKFVWKYMVDNHNIDLQNLSSENLKASAAIFHLEEFSEGLNLPKSIPIYIMGPAIDPLSFKNMPLSQEFIVATLSRYGIVKNPIHDEAYQIAHAKSNIQEDQHEEYIPPYVIEVSRYDPYKGPFEICVAFIEAMRSLDTAEESSAFFRDNCRLVFAASTPGDNPSGVEILRNLTLFLDNCPVLKEFESKGSSLRERMFLLSLKDQRRTEVLRKTLFDKIWEISKHKKELMVRDVLTHSAVSPLEELIEKLLSGPSPLITEEMASFLRNEGEKLVEANMCAYFTLEQTSAALKCFSESNFLDASVWIKVKNNYLSGKEMNHLEVNALQTGAFVRCQFSSKEGFGLVVSEAMVKKEVCTPPINGVMVATKAGGVKTQIAEERGIPVEYPPEDVAQSLKMYREMEESHVDSEGAAKKLYDEIASRQSVKDFGSAIAQALRMNDEERVLKNKNARKFVLENFSIHSNVINILKALVMAVQTE